MPIRSLNFWHDALIDYMLENPDCSLRDLSNYFGKSVAWISTVRNSDMFKARLEERRAELSAYLSASISDKLDGLIDQAIETLASKLDDHEEVTFDDARKLLDTALRGRGYGVAKAQPGQDVNVSVTVTQDVLSQARERYRQRMLEQQPNNTLEGQVVYSEPRKLGQSSS